MSPVSNGEQDPPQGYRKRELDWFQEGRIFTYWSPNKSPISGKVFVIESSSHNDRGHCLRVDTISEEDEKDKDARFYRTRVLVKKYDVNASTDSQLESQDREKKVYLDEYNEKDVSARTYICLDPGHTVYYVGEHYRLYIGDLDTRSVRHLSRCYSALISHDRA